MKKSYFHHNILVIFFLFSNITGCQTNPKPFTEEFSNQQAIENSLDDKQLFKASTVDEAVIKAHQALQNGNQNLALIYYINAFTIDSTNIVVLKEMATLYQKLQKPDLVATCYRLILEQEPDDITTQKKYGLLLITQKNLNQAKQSLNKVIQIDIKSWQSYNGLGIISDIEGKHTQAQEYFRKAILHHPQTKSSKHAVLLNNMGYSLYRDNKPNAAKKYFMLALKVNPKFKKPLFNYALIIAREKNYSEAVSIFSKSISVSEANNNTGYIAMMNNDFDKAYYYFKQAIKLSPKFSQKAYDNLNELDNRRIWASTNSLDVTS